MKSRLYKKYFEEVRPALVEKRGYDNPHEVPRSEGKAVRVIDERER